MADEVAAVTVRLCIIRRYSQCAAIELRWRQHTWSRQLTPVDCVIAAYMARLTVVEPVTWVYDRSIVRPTDYDPAFRGNVYELLRRGRLLAMQDIRAVEAAGQLAWPLPPARVLRLRFVGAAGPGGGYAIPVLRLRFAAGWDGEGPSWRWAVGGLFWADGWRARLLPYQYPELFGLGQGGAYDE